MENVSTSPVPAVAILCGVLTSVALLSIHSIERARDIRVEIVAVTPQADGYHVAFAAHNPGGRTAHAVVVLGDIDQGEATEHAETNIGYVAASSASYGALLFQRDPRHATLSVEARESHHYRARHVGTLTSRRHFRTRAE